jgi:hypothetical protein
MGGCIQSRYREYRLQRRLKRFDEAASSSLEEIKDLSSKINAEQEAIETIRGAIFTEVKTEDELQGHRAYPLLVRHQMLLQQLQANMKQANITLTKAETRKASALHAHRQADTHRILAAAALKSGPAASEALESASALNEILDEEDDNADGAAIGVGQTSTAYAVAENVAQEAIADEYHARQLTQLPTPPSRSLVVSSSSSVAIARPTTIPVTL